MARKSRPAPKAAPQSESGIGGWLKNQFWNTSLVWLIAMFAAGLGFYYNTQNTLANHETSIQRMATTFADTKRDDAADRAKVREAFLADGKATAIGMAKLNEQTAVITSVLSGVQRELEKIVAKLDGIKK